MLARVAGPDDAGLVAELLYEFNGEGLAPAALAARMEQAAGIETAFLGEWEGSPAGLLILRLVPTLSGAEDWAEITEMYVRPGFRRKKIGKVMLQAAIAHARERGCHELHLLVDPRNGSAQTFYSTLGFRLDSWEMRREI